jgi:hypothetical protein
MKAGLSLAVAALLGVATYNYADNTPAESEIFNLASHIEDNQRFVDELEADDYANLKGLSTEEFESAHEEAMERLAGNMDIILNMGTTALDAQTAKRAFTWIRANNEEYKRIGKDLNFNALIEDMENQTNKLLEGQQIIRTVGVDLMDNTSSALDNFQGFVEMMNEVAEVEDPVEKAEATEGAKEMFQDHMKALLGVTSRSTEIVSQLADKFSVIQKGLLATTQRAKSQAGAAQSRVNRQISEIKADIQNLEKRVNLRNSALDALKLTKYTYKAVPMPLIKKADNCVNKNK